MRRLGPQGGQATVELVALLPVAASVGLALVAFLSAGAASRAADTAAEAGALAILQERDPEAAAREALEEWPRRLARVHVRGGRVTVRVRSRIRVPALARLLDAASTAHAGFAHPARPADARGGDGTSGSPGRGEDR